MHEIIAESEARYYHHDHQRHSRKDPITDLSIQK